MIELNTTDVDEDANVTYSNVKIFLVDGILCMLQPVIQCMDIIY